MLTKEKLESWYTQPPVTPKEVWEGSPRNFAKKLLPAICTRSPYRDRTRRTIKVGDIIEGRGIVSLQRKFAYFLPDGKMLYPTRKEWYVGDWHMSYLKKELENCLVVGHISENK